MGCIGYAAQRTITYTSNRDTGMDSFRFHLPIYGHGSNYIGDNYGDSVYRDQNS